ncbi:nuclear transport factor 2 family protein [Roseateles puraquae]|uniref:nuclear transport factor 2 family protein n=1 Tax=Roseateles puraquae TaxID=431059 RepID=UPI0031D1D247
MKTHRLMPALFIASLLAAVPLHATAVDAAPSPPLHEQIAALDAAVFDAFNRCADPAQLQRHASYFAEGVEFYHDNGGVTWNRADMLANTRQHACGNYRRELVPGTLRVYPIKDFGAIAQGTHRFCQMGATRSEGAADFLIAWRRDGDRWLITRVFSYGHRAE